MSHNLQPTTLHAAMTTTVHAGTPSVDPLLASHHRKFTTGNEKEDPCNDAKKEHRKPEEAPALRALQLRYRFGEHTFNGLVWKSLQAAGWTFHSGSYYHNRCDGNCTISFESSKALIEYLDQGALPVFYSNLQSSRTTKNLTATSNDESVDNNELQVKLRREALMHMHRLVQDEENDDDDDESSSQNQGNESKADVPSVTRRSAGIPTGSATALDAGAELYWKKKKKKKTSGGSGKMDGKDNSAVGSAILQLPTLAECAAFVTSQEVEVAPTEASYHKLFSKWRFLLSTNHSLLFFGWGSKYNLLEQFASSELGKEGPCLVIDGFDKQVTVDGILDLFVQMYLDGKEPDLETPAVELEHSSTGHDIGGERGASSSTLAAIVARARAVGRAYAHAAAASVQSILPAFLVIHSVDAPGLLSFRKNAYTSPISIDQSALAALAFHSTVPNGVRAIRLVASVDHVDATTRIMEAYPQAAWLPVPVHTQRPTHREWQALFQDQEREQQRKLRYDDVVAERANRVIPLLGSLAPRHTDVLQVLALLQLQSGKAVKFGVYRTACKERCPVPTDHQLRVFVRELVDNGLIKWERDSSSNEDCVSIPYPPKKLQEILDFNRRAEPGSGGSK